MRRWARWLPRQYAAISDTGAFFTTLGEEVARQIDELTEQLMDEIGQARVTWPRWGGCSRPALSPRNWSFPNASCQTPNWPAATSMTTRQQKAQNGRWS
jgi:hypothetical protein